MTTIDSVVAYELLQIVCDFLLLTKIKRVKNGYYKKYSSGPAE